MKIKELLIWNKMLYNRGGSYLPDGIFGAIVGSSIVMQGINSIPIIILISFLRWLSGYADYKFKLIHIETELGIRKQNPYLDKKLNGKRQ